MSYNKRICTAVLALLIVFSTTGCMQTHEANSSNMFTSSLPVSAVNRSDSEMFSDNDKEVGYDNSTAISIILSNDSIQCDSNKVKISGNTVTIADEGTYLVSGTLDNGQLMIDAEKTDKLQLVLNGVNLNCDTSAAIYVKQADKVFITLASGSQNSLSNQSEFVAIDDNSIDSIVFSKDDLTINGAGTLTVNAAYGHGIVSKDDLIITSGTYKITAASHALSGNDSVRIADGSFALTSGKDGVQAENSEDTALGYVYIAGGNFEITSAGDGISASSDLQIENGNFRINTGGGSQNGAVKQDDMMMRPDAREKLQADATTEPATNMSTAVEADTISTKGIKATGNLSVGGGKITIDSADDALHANSNIVITGGTLVLSSGDDGVHADANATINAGELTVVKSYEGIEGQSIDIMGGILTVTADDDGINAAGGNDQSGFGGGMGKDKFTADESSYIKISGGTITVNASGDGIDSNGGLYVSGGETYVSGPTSSGNGALDYSGESQITGGIFVAVGGSGMAQNFGSSSTQGAILVNVSDNAANTALLLKDSSSNTVLSYAPQKTYSSVVISCPQIKQGENYTLEIGEQSTAIEMTSLIYGVGGGMDGGRPNGGMGEKPRGLD